MLVNRGWIPEEMAGECPEPDLKEDEEMTFEGFLQPKQAIVCYFCYSSKLIVTLLIYIFVGWLGAEYSQRGLMILMSRRCFGHILMLTLSINGTKTRLK